MVDFIKKYQNFFLTLIAIIVAIVIWLFANDSQRWLEMNRICQQLKEFLQMP